MTQDDQRPDLDAALDAVIPSLTAVDDDAAAASLRRTRTALAERSGPDARSWRWMMPAAAAVATAIIAAVVFWPRTPVTEPTRVAVRTNAPAAPVLPVEHPPVAPIVVPPRVIRPEPPAPVAPVAATSAPRPDASPRPDPLVALVSAVQAIPEDAWRRGTNADAPVTIDPIVVAPIETPPLPDLAPEPVAPGEP